MTVGRLDHVCNNLCFPLTGKKKVTSLRSSRSGLLLTIWFSSQSKVCTCKLQNNALSGIQKGDA